MQKKNVYIQRYLLKRSWSLFRYRELEVLQLTHSFFYLLKGLGTIQLIVVTYHSARRHLMNTSLGNLAAHCTSLAPSRCCLLLLSLPFLLALPLFLPLRSSRGDWNTEPWHKLPLASWENHFFDSTQKAERCLLCCGCSVTSAEEEFAVPGRWLHLILL